VARIAVTVDEYQYTFVVTTRLILLKNEKVSGKLCRENQTTYLTFGNFFFPSKIVPFIR